MEWEFRNEGLVYLIEKQKEGRQAESPRNTYVIVPLAMWGGVSRVKNLVSTPHGFHRPSRVQISKRPWRPATEHIPKMVKTMGNAMFKIKEAIVKESQSQKGGRPQTAPACLCEAAKH